MVPPALARGALVLTEALRGDHHHHHHHYYHDHHHHHHHHHHHDNVEDDIYDEDINLRDDTRITFS